MFVYSCRPSFFVRVMECNFYLDRKKSRIETERKDFETIFYKQPLVNNRD